jgi:hypothetical protein
MQKAKADSMSESQSNLEFRDVKGMAPGSGARTNKAGMSFGISDGDGETHATHKDCDKSLWMS